MDRFESEPDGEGERDLFVKAELDRGDLLFSKALVRADITRVRRSGKRSMGMRRRTGWLWPKAKFGQ